MTLSSNLENHDSLGNQVQARFDQLQMRVDSIADVAAAERQGRALTKYSYYCVKEANV